MKKLYSIISVAFILLVFGCGSKSENTIKDQSPIKNEEFLNSLTKVESYELEGMKVSDKTKVYTEDGKLLSKLEIVKITQSGDYSLDAFRNKQGEIIWLFQRLTEEIKKAKIDVEKTLGLKTDMVGKNAIPFSMKDMEGHEYSLQNQERKVIVMNFWFIACGPCVAEMPGLNKLVEEYKEEEVVFLGFALDAKEKLVPFLEKKKFDYIIIPGSEKVSTSYKVQAFPTHVVIDKKSQIKYYYTGGLEANSIVDLKKEIDAALAN